MLPTNNNYRTVSIAASGLTSIEGRRSSLVLDARAIEVSGLEFGFIVGRVQQLVEGSPLPIEDEHKCFIDVRWVFIPVARLADA